MNKTDKSLDEILQEGFKEMRREKEDNCSLPMKLFHFTSTFLITIAIAIIIIVAVLGG
jgi:hypothetical protein